MSRVWLLALALGCGAPPQDAACAWTLDGALLVGPDQTLALAGVTRADLDGDGRDDLLASIEPCAAGDSCDWLAATACPTGRLRLAWGPERAHQLSPTKAGFELHDWLIVRGCEAKTRAPVTLGQAGAVVGAACREGALWDARRCGEPPAPVCR